MPQFLRHHLKDHDQFSVAVIIIRTANFVLRILLVGWKVMTVPAYAEIIKDEMVTLSALPVIQFVIVSVISPFEIVGKKS